MTRALALVVAIAGCGRIDFAAQRDGALADGTIGDRVAAPDAAAQFTNRQQVANVNTTFREFGPSISSDGLELYLVSDRSTIFELYRATRAAITDDFGSPAAEMFGGSISSGEPALARGNLEIYIDDTDYSTRTDPQSAWGAATADPSLMAAYGGIDLGGGDLRLVMFDTNQNTLFEATRATLGGAWSAPVALPELDIMPNNNYPTMTDDGLEVLWQACAAPGNPCTVLHAYRSALGAAFGPASPALALPAGVSAGDPGVSGDGHTLYYASDEAMPGGNSDLWVAFRP